MLNIDSALTDSCCFAFSTVVISSNDFHLNKRGSNPSTSTYKVAGGDDLQTSPESKQLKSINKQKFLNLSTNLDSLSFLNATIKLG